MRPEMLELLARGRKQGYVTFEDVNAALAAGGEGDSGALARILEQLEGADIELLDAEDATETPHEDE